ncbi:hypothetical protein LguiA_027831 [Lonicera macranthoides]
MDSSFWVFQAKFLRQIFTRENSGELVKFFLGVKLELVHTWRNIVSNYYIDLHLLDEVQNGTISCHSHVGATVAGLVGATVEPRLKPDHRR